jgi:hypothetical protein
LIENLINVVGTLNMEELDEILAIARVFLVEERMKSITYHMKIENIIEEAKLREYKPKNSYKILCENLPKLTVRGLD